MDEKTRKNAKSRSKRQKNENTSPAPGLEFGEIRAFLARATASTAALDCIWKTVCEKVERHSDRAQKSATFCLSAGIDALRYAAFGAAIAAYLIDNLEPPKGVDLTEWYYAILSEMNFIESDMATFWYYRVNCLVEVLLERGFDRKNIKTVVHAVSRILNEKFT